MPLQCCKDKFPTIPDEEPVFILRGKDRLALDTVEHWIALAQAAGVNDEKMQSALVHRDAMRDFAQRYPERMKTPD